MTEGHGRTHGNGVPGEQAQLHTRLALGYAVTHGRRAPGHLSHRPHSTGRLPNNIRELFVGLVGRKHIVIGRYHGHVGLVHEFQGVFVALITGRETVGQIAAGQRAPVWRLGFEGIHAVQVILPRWATALDDSLGNLIYGRVHGGLHCVIY